MKTKKRPIDYEDDDELFDDIFPVASSCECTGLMPFAVHDESEIKSYGRIYDIPLSDSLEDNE